MSRVKIYDAPGGDTVIYHQLKVQHDTLNFCTFNLDPVAHQQLLEHIPEIKCRPDDVFLVAYPKCGKLFNSNTIIWGGIWQMHYKIDVACVFIGQVFYNLFDTRFTIPTIS